MSYFGKSLVDIVLRNELETPAAKHRHPSCKSPLYIRAYGSTAGTPPQLEDEGAKSSALPACNSNSQSRG